MLAPQKGTIVAEEQPDRRAASGSPVADAGERLSGSWVRLSDSHQPASVLPTNVASLRRIWLSMSYGIAGKEPILESSNSTVHP